MDAMSRIERTLEATIARASGPGAPPLLARALAYAVFPGGTRLRPRLCLAVAGACGDHDPALADAAAAAIELLHCASLVHDDLPAFDDAAMRRGKPSVHRQYGEPIAVLAGDALIVLAFEALAHAATKSPGRLAPVTLIVARSVGMPNGIAAGQAWECEPSPPLGDYQRAKTGALFAAATAAGAAAAGHDIVGWRLLGERLGEAYQVADDIRDVESSPEELGKPVGRDVALGRPSAVTQYGLDGAKRLLEELVDGAIGSVPACPGALAFRRLVVAEANRFLPRDIARRAA